MSPASNTLSLSSFKMSKWRYQQKDIQVYSSGEKSWGAVKIKMLNKDKNGVRALVGEKNRESESHSVMSDSLQPHGLYSPWNSPSQNTGVDSLSLLQGMFPIQGLNPGLWHSRRILHQLSHKGNPRILEWVAYPFSSNSSRTRNWTGVSCIAGEFFTNWAIREAHEGFWLLIRCWSWDRNLRSMN